MFNPIQFTIKFTCLKKIIRISNQDKNNRTTYKFHIRQKIFYRNFTFKTQ